jgi:ABC-type lipoprotein release transport system permease subunit
MFFSKKGQLGIIEFKFFLFGLAFGVVALIVLIALINGGVLDFALPLITCPAPA